MVFFRLSWSARERKGIQALLPRYGAQPLGVCCDDLLEFHEGFGGEILTELNEQPPSYVVDATADANSFAAQDSMYQGFRDFVARHYSLVRAFSDVKIYKLADLPRK